MRDGTSAALRKLRAVAGLGMIGAAIGFVAGSVADVLLRLAVIAVEGVPDVPDVWSYILSRAAAAAVDWGLLGAFTGTGFAAMLAVADRKRTLEELPRPRMAVFGAVAGALFMCGLVFLQGAGRYLLRPSVLAAVAVASALGAGLTTSMVALAKKARRREIAGVEELRACSDPE